MDRIAEMKIIFIHQAKTGGTTLVQSFRDTYGHNNVYMDIDHRKLNEMSRLRKKLELIIQPYRKYCDREQYKVIHGHFSIWKYKKRFPSAYYITFYRHPVQRVVSVYHFWIRNPQLSKYNSLCQWLHNEHPNIVEFAFRFKENDNRYFYEFIPERFDFVGITERYDESMELLRLFLPELKIDTQPQRINPDKTFGEKYKIDDREYTELSIVLKRRIEIYNWSLKLFEGEWTRYFNETKSKY